jgi:hypothetical protein
MKSYINCTFYGKTGKQYMRSNSYLIPTVAVHAQYTVKTNWLKPN